VRLVFCVLLCAAAVAAVSSDRAAAGTCRPHKIAGHCIARGVCTSDSYVSCEPNTGAGPPAADWARPQDVKGVNLPFLARTLKQVVVSETGATGGEVYYEKVRSYLAFPDEGGMYISFCGRLTYANIRTGAAPTDKRFFVAESMSDDHRVVFGEEDLADPAKFERVHQELCRGNQGPAVWR
jgi:hypothetical protein